jgi:16S rRNA (uracil1498-N3)-methyltransferase
MSNNYLSNIELYYTNPENVNGKEISLGDEEFEHAVKVMRHRMGEELYITNGQGKIFSGTIFNIFNDYLTMIINKEITYENKLQNIIFCLPKLKSNERFEFALEKCVELGITNFIVFSTERTATKHTKLERLQKISISAMKQSLRTFLPVISEVKSLQDISNLSGEKLLFEQNAARYFEEYNYNTSLKSYFIFGPEGGFSQKEIGLFKEESLFRLAVNRLRTETAIIKCASLL